MLQHPIPPLYDERSALLILGSFPSVKSREAGFFYGHPQNRFWRVLAAVWEQDVPQTIPEKRAFLLGNGIALWDTIGSCEIVGSSDSSIRDVTPNDLTPLLASGHIRRIYCNGRTSFQLYRRWLEPVTGRTAQYLPSTSPANAAWSLARLIAAWSVLRTEEG